MKIQFNIKQTKKGNYSLYVNVREPDFSVNEIYLSTFSKLNIANLARMFFEQSLKLNQKNFLFNLLNSNKDNFYSKYKLDLYKYFQTKGFVDIDEQENQNSYLEELDINFDDSVLRKSLDKEWIGDIKSLEEFKRVVERGYNIIKGNLELKDQMKNVKDKVTIPLILFESLKRIEGKLLIRWFNLEGKMNLPEVTDAIELILNTMDSAINIPSNFKGNLTISQKLPYLPKSLIPPVLESLSLGGCGLNSFENSPLEVKGRFNCGYNHVKNFQGTPLKVGGDFEAVHLKELVTLKGISPFIGGNLNLSELPKLSLKGLFEGLQGITIKGTLSLDLGIRKNYIKDEYRTDCRILKEEINKEYTTEEDFINYLKSLGDINNLNIVNIKSNRGLNKLY